MSRTLATHRAATPVARSGPEGNERLTAITGAILLVLFAAEGFTILAIQGLLYWHYFIGLLLIGPICVKICSTVYRFARYYTGHPEYVRKGPPMPLLRLLGPFVILTTVGVMATGLALGFEHSDSFHGIPLLFLHKASFVLWFGVMGIHVLAYVWRLPALVGSDLPATRAFTVASTVGGRALRWSLTVLALGAGLAAATAWAHLADSWPR